MPQPDYKLPEGVERYDPDFSEAGAPSIRSQERQRARETLATVRGHLEGYADAVALSPSFERGRLVAALRKDAERLAALGSLEDGDE